MHGRNTNFCIRCITAGQLQSKQDASGGSAVISKLQHPTAMQDGQMYMDRCIQQPNPLVYITRCIASNHAHMSQQYLQSVAQCSIAANLIGGDSKMADVPLAFMQYPCTIPFYSFSSTWSIIKAHKLLPQPKRSAHGSISS